MMVVVMAYNVLGEGAEAVMLGPYNVTMGLSGFNDVQSTGPNKNLEGGYVTYQMSMASGNSTMPSDDVNVPKIIIQIVKYNMPVNIDDQSKVENIYDLTANRAFPVGMDYSRDGVMLDGQWAAWWKSALINYHFITYFKNRNVQVGLGAFDLSPQDFNILIRTFHIQEA